MRDAFAQSIVQAVRILIPASPKPPEAVITSVSSVVVMFAVTNALAVAGQEVNLWRRH